MDPLATSLLFQQFLTQRRYLKNVTPSTIEWYETAFKALQDLSAQTRRSRNPRCKRSSVPFGSVASSPSPATPTSRRSIPSVSGSVRKGISRRQWRSRR